MILKALWTAAAIGLVAGLAAPDDAHARSSKTKRAYKEQPVRDCTPYNGPFGYYGNPWCDGGWKFAEDYAPGTGPDYDLLDLPQLKRLHHRRRY